MLTQREKYTKVTKNEPQDEPEAVTKDTMTLDVVGRHGKEYFKKR